MAQSVERIVHIDGVVGSSPTVTTTKPLQDNACKGFSYSRMSRFNSCRQFLPATRSHREIRTLENSGCVGAFFMGQKWFLISSILVDVDEVVESM